MGVMIMGVTMLLFLIEFPMWGSMLTPARTTISEHDYYIAEWTPLEVANGLHNMSMRFADESKCVRAWAHGWCMCAGAWAGVLLACKHILQD